MRSCRASTLNFSSTVFKPLGKRSSSALTSSSAPVKNKVSLACNRSLGVTGDMKFPSLKISARKSSFKFLSPADLTVLPSILPPGITLSSLVYWRLVCTAAAAASSDLFRINGERSSVVKSTAPVTARPGRRKSQKANPGIPFSIIRPFRTRLVEVPMSVMVPPATAAKERGIKNRPTFQPFSCAFDFNSGMSSATTGVLLINPLSVAVMRELLIRTLLGLLPKRSMMR